MLIQYPHILTGTITADGSQDEETGDWIAGEASPFEIKCRAESSDGNGYITKDDGTTIDFSWIVYIPNPVNKIQIGTTVTVANADGVFLKDDVKRFSQGQLNSRVWL